VIDESTIKDLQQKVQSARIQQAKVEAEAEAAKKVVNDLRIKLKDEYGVNTGAEIREKLDSLRTERDLLLQKAVEELENAGA